MAYYLRSQSLNQEPSSPLINRNPTSVDGTPTSYKPTAFRPLVDATGYGFHSLLSSSPVVCLDLTSVFTSASLAFTSIKSTDTTHSIPQPLSSPLAHSGAAATAQPTPSPSTTDSSTFSAASSSVTVKPVPSTSAAPCPQTL